MTDLEFIDEINRGKRVLCFTPEQCMNVIGFLVDRGYRLSCITEDKFKQGLFNDSWLCPGLSGNEITTWSYKYIQRLASTTLSYHDFASFYEPPHSIEIDTEQLFEAIGI